MKKIIYILLYSIGFTACNTIGGLYKHEICGKAPDCFLIDVCKNGTFTYWYSQDILGSETLTGKWIRNKDTVYFKADQYLFNVKSDLICKQNNDTNTTTIQIALLRKYFKDKKDTTHCDWIVKINDEPRKYSTDSKGLLTIPYKSIKKITVRDSFTDLGIEPLIKMEDSTFVIPENTNDIKIYLADNNSTPIILWSDRKMKIKNNKLISILPDSLKNSRSDRFIRVKRKCGNIKTK